MFSTMSHKRLFNVLLVDLLSKPQKDDFGLPDFPTNAFGSEATFLRYLRVISQNPTLNATSESLANPVQSFAAWLDADCVVDKVWLPSIDIETTIRVPRIFFIKICGDIAKHSFPRMSVNASRIKKLLSENGHKITVEQAYLAMNDFYQWFHTDIFSYHASTISEFLNNIQWGIYGYLLPEFSRSFRKMDGSPIFYEFDVPPECRGTMTHSMYWELMNWVRRRPYLPPFTVTKYLKLRY